MVNSTIGVVAASFMNGVVVKRLDQLISIDMFRKACHFLKCEVRESTLLEKDRG